MTLNLREDTRAKSQDALVKMYLSTYKYLKPLYLVLKKFLLNMNLFYLPDHPGNSEKVDHVDSRTSYTPSPLS